MLGQKPFEKYRAGIGEDETLTLVSCVTALMNMTGIAGCNSFSFDSAMDPALRSHRAPWEGKDT